VQIDQIQDPGSEVGGGGGWCLFHDEQMIWIQYFLFVLGLEVPTGRG
jgi:hypothetical protein